MASDTVSFHVDAAPADVWRVAGERWDEVYRLVPRISRSVLTSDGGIREGATRRCSLSEPALGMDHIDERLVGWDPPRSFAYEVIDPPFPLRRLGNSWTVEPEGDGTRLSLTPTVELRGRPVTRPLEGIVLRRTIRRLESDLRGLSAGIEGAVDDLARTDPLR